MNERDRDAAWGLLLLAGCLTRRTLQLRIQVDGRSAASGETSIVHPPYGRPFAHASALALDIQTRGQASLTVSSPEGVSTHWVELITWPSGNPRLVDDLPTLQAEIVVRDRRVLLVLTKQGGYTVKFLLNGRIE
jgi:hypothetical protein